MQRVTAVLFGLWLWLLHVCRLVTHVETRGAPHEGACVIVANHPSLFDVNYLIRDIPGLSVLVKRALVRTLPLGSIFRASGYILAPDAKEGSPLEALQEAVDVLRRGGKFLVFPEGGRSPKGELGAFRAGAFVIARKAGVPVQPVLIRCEPPFLPREDRWYYPPREMCVLTMDFWEPIAPPAEGGEREAVRALRRRYEKALGLAQGEEDAA